MKKVILGAIFLAAATTTPAMAGYVSNVVAPQITHTGTAFSSANFAVLQTSGPAILGINFNIGYPTSSSSSVVVRICSRNLNICDTTWRSRINSTSFFNGYPISTQFYVQTAVPGTVGTALNPPISASGLSTLIVNN